MDTKLVTDNVDNIEKTPAMIAAEEKIMGNRLPATTNGLDPNDPNLLGEAHFSGTEEADIALAMSVRRRQIKAMTARGMPTSARDVEVLNQTLSGLEDTAFKKAKLRDSIRDTNASVMNAETMAAIFREGRKSRASLPPMNISKTLDDKTIDIEVVPGELELDAAPLDIDDFITKAEKIDAI